MISTIPSASPAACLLLVSKTPSDLRIDLTTMVIRALLGPAGGPEEEQDGHEGDLFSRNLVGRLAPAHGARF